MVNVSSIDPLVLHAWLSGRSISRGVPQPVPDRGGFRVDSNTDAEICRWVFPKIDSALIKLALSVQEPRRFVEVCAGADELRTVLPRHWQVQASYYFMQASDARLHRHLSKEYISNVSRTGDALEVRIWTGIGALAASGYGGETPAAFVYDRIVTAPEHRRRGLGHVVMAMLQAAKRHTGSRELLVATEDGRALYSKLGWRTISLYSTASIMMM
jgi:GNAT superfamily N-acetyltransferase